MNELENKLNVAVELEELLLKALPWGHNREEHKCHNVEVFKYCTAIEVLSGGKPLNTIYSYTIPSELSEALLSTVHNYINEVSK